MIAEAFKALFSVQAECSEAKHRSRYETKELPIGEGRRLVFCPGEDGSVVVHDIQKRTLKLEKVSIEHFPSKVLDILGEDETSVFVGEEAFSRIETDDCITLISSELPHTSTWESLLEGREVSMGANELVRLFAVSFQDCFANPGDWERFKKTLKTIVAEKKRQQTTGSAGASYGASVTATLRSEVGSIEDWEQFELHVQVIDAPFVAKSPVRVILDVNPDTMTFKYDLVDVDTTKAIKNAKEQVVAWLKSSFAQDPASSVSVYLGTVHQSFAKVE